MPETFLLCESCGDCISEDNGELGDITRDGAECCNANTFVYVGGYCSTPEKEEDLRAIIEEWEKKNA